MSSVSFRTRDSGSRLLIKTSYLKELAPLKKTYKIGDSGPEVTKIGEWLMLWQLNENYAKELLRIRPDAVFDNTTEAVTKDVQEFLELPVTGQVDAVTWNALLSPMSAAFDMESYCHKSMREKMVYYASRHLQYRAAELEANNMGPWVRAYMDDYEGEWAYWCAGFVSTILDQAFSSVGKNFTDYYISSWLVEDHRHRARENHRLVTNQQLQNKEYTPRYGDIVIYISDADSRAHHIEIVFDVLDSDTGVMRTIGGNTNFSSSHNGVGTFIVDRCFMNENVEIIKMVEG